MRKGTECLSLSLPLRTSSSKELKVNHPALSYAATIIIIIIISITSIIDIINVITYNPFVISKTDKYILVI
jgi:hypothetical protein